MIKALFAAVLALSFSLPAFAGNPADDAFNKAIDDINAAVAKITAAKAKRSQQVKTAEKKSGKAAVCTPAQIDDAYASVPRCEDALKKAFNVSVRDYMGALNKGFSRSGYSLVLLTTTDAYFYHEDCDICAAVDRCELKTGKLTDYKVAHSVDCADLAPVIKNGGVVYSACP